MSLEFPFEYGDIEGLGRLFYPIVKLDVLTIDGWREFSFLIDTGADVTTVPSHLLPILGIKESELPTSKTFGVGGRSIKTREFKMRIRFKKKELLVHSSAIGTKNDSMPLLLGRKDIFEEQFNLLIDSHRKVTVISPNQF